MKYIRTKDGIYDGEKYDADYFLDMNLGKVIKQSDTIEELCDEFMVMNNNVCMDLFSSYNNLKNSGWYRSDIDIYGAIYTDKGLIYVAKMNSEGELMLI